MENYPSYSYPDSGDSSPRSREIDFENPPLSWEDQPPPSHHHLTKVKFMVSYGGKIQPRSHDNLLSYVGGETKILSVDRTVKFAALLSKLSAILSPQDLAASDGFTFKYQLPGEELDALISVTNDDDLENMMHEYDRLYRGSVKPARLRLFLFPNFKSGSFGSTSSDPGGKMIDGRDSDRFVEGLGLNSNSGLGLGPQPAAVVQPPPLVQQQLPVLPVHHVNSSSNTNNNSNVDFLFGLEKSNPVHVPVQIPVPVQDPQIDARVQELNRMQISGQKNEPDHPGVFPGGAPASIPASVQIPAGYWQGPPPVNVEQPPPQPPPPQQQQMPSQHQLHPQHQQQQQFHPQSHQLQPPPQQQHVYMMHAPPQQQQPPPNMMHVPQTMMRPNQAFYQVHPQHQQQQQQQPPQQPIYRDQPPPPQQQQQHQQHQQQPQPIYNMGPGPGKMGGYSESMGVPVRPMPGMGPESQGYTQVAYDSGSGRQVYCATQQQQGGGGGGVVTTPFQGGGVPANGSGEMRTMAAEAKVVQKVVPSSNPV